MSKYIVVGSGFAGTVCAYFLAKKGYEVDLYEKKKHIAGNMFDYYDKNGLLVHKYGPHIIMTDSDEIRDFIKSFVDITSIDVSMEVMLFHKPVPLPINFNSIKMIYTKKKSNTIIKHLLNSYTMDTEINILNLLNSDDDLIKEFAKDIYEKVFVGYNSKMWGLKPTDLDKSVVGRAPVRLSYDNTRSKKKYNFVPKYGYANLFEEMLKHNNINVIKNQNIKNYISIENNTILMNGKPLEGKVIYTGSLDELFDYKFGKLPYRSVEFKNKLVMENNYFNGLAVTFPMKYKKFRTSDMSRVTGIYDDNKRILTSEYSGEYNNKSKKFNNESYPIINDKNINLYNKYKEEALKVKNLYFIGRLAEYKYYDMSQVIEASFNLLEDLKVKVKNDESI